MGETTERLFTTGELGRGPFTKLPVKSRVGQEEAMSIELRGSVGSEDKRERQRLTRF